MNTLQKAYDFVADPIPTEGSSEGLLVLWRLNDPATCTICGGSIELTDLCLYNEAEELAAHCYPYLNPHSSRVSFLTYSEANSLRRERCFMKPIIMPTQMLDHPSIQITSESQMWSRAISGTLHRVASSPVFRVCCLP